MAVVVHSSPTYMASTLPVLFLTLSSLSTLSAAYTWNFVSPPQQCSNLTVSLAGSGGIPPYRILVLPFGATTLSSGLEVRTILDVAFPADSTTVSFQLKYPANSQLVAVVSYSFLQFSFVSLHFSCFLLSLSCFCCVIQVRISDPSFLVSKYPTLSCRGRNSAPVDVNKAFGTIWLCQ